jgi:hypothetical protein
MHQKKITQTIKHIIASDMPINDNRQALPTVLINDRQNLGRTAIMGAVAHKIVGPHMIAVRWSQSHT